MGGPPLSDGMPTWGPDRMVIPLAIPRACVLGVYLIPATSSSGGTADRVSEARATHGACCHVIVHILLEPGVARPLLPRPPEGPHPLAPAPAPPCVPSEMVDRGVQAADHPSRHRGRVRIESARLIAGCAHVRAWAGRGRPRRDGDRPGAVSGVRVPHPGPGSWPAKLRASDRLRAGRRGGTHAELGRADSANRRRWRSGRALDDASRLPARLVFTACQPILARGRVASPGLAALDTAEIRAPSCPGATVASASPGQRRSRGARTVRGAAGGGPRGAPGVGGRGSVPGLQRGLLGHHGRRLDAAGPVRGRAAPGPHPGRAGAGRARGARAGGAHGDPGLARPRADRSFR